jgi:hypothetical protein
MYWILSKGPKVQRTPLETPWETPSEDSRYWIGFFNDQLLILVTYLYIFVSKIFYQESSIENRASSINPVYPFGITPSIFLIV